MNLCTKHTFISATIVFSVICLSTVLKAQEVEIASSLNPVGSGARATGMGGAFIGVADDATAASWNPAGLVLLEKPETSIVYSYFHRNQNYSSTVDPEMESDNSMNADNINYVSIAYPFELFNRNIIISLNYQRLFEMNKEISFRMSQPLFGETYVGTLDFKQEGFLYAISPAMAVQVIPQLYIGGTLNRWDNFVGRNGWETNQNEFVSGMFAGSQFHIRHDTKINNSFEGTNANFGFLWMINDSFTLGGVYKTPFDAELERKTVKRDIVFVPPNDIDVTTETVENLTLKMPSSYGLGLSYRHSDSWTIALDVYITEWSKSVLRDENGNETIMTDGSSTSSGRLKDTTQVRLGTEYLFIREKDVIPVRFGVFYDPEPQKGHLDEYFGFSFGTGYYRGRIAFDMSYQYRRGRDLTGDIANFPGSSVDIDQHTLMSSLIFYFSE